MRGPGVSGAAADPAWVPGEAVRERSRLLAAAKQWGFADVTDLHRASVDDPEWFWRAATQDLQVQFSTPFGRVLDERAGKPFPRWFPGGRINVATLCSHRHATGSAAGRTAVVYQGDSGQRRALTFAELDVQVRRFAANLQGMGVQAGDRVVLFLPVVPEAAVAFLGCAMIGAVVVPAFSGYAADTLATRIRESQAVVLVTADGTTRRGRPVAMKQIADAAVAASSSIRKVVVVRHLGGSAPMTVGRDVYYDELPSDPTPVETRAMGSNDPLMVVYTSGTTGRPKGIVHSHGGFAAKTAVDFGYGFDVHAGDVVAWITDLGWLVGPMLIVGGLQLGATIVLTEGVPNHPTPNRLWAIARREGVTHQGIAPTAARALMARGATPDPGDLDTVHTFLSTGEPWDEQTWRWLFGAVGSARRPIVNYSGGTEIGGGILIGYPFLPMEVGAFNGPLPGIDAAVLGEDGTPVTGQMGELSVLNTWPGMTHAFWGDRDRYLDTYWARWEGVWVHGDLASVDECGSWRVHGRSDDTLNISGRRVGPAEIETAILQDPRVEEVAVIGVPDPQHGQLPVAFVVPTAGTDPSDIARAAAEHTGRAFAPTVQVVTALPKTRNGKILRRAIRARYLGSDPGDMTALDPATPLDAISKRVR